MNLVRQHRFTKIAVTALEAHSTMADGTCVASWRIALVCHTVTLKATTDLSYAMSPISHVASVQSDGRKSAFRGMLYSLLAFT